MLMLFCWCEVVCKCVEVSQVRLILGAGWEPRCQGNFAKCVFCCGDAAWRYSEVCSLLSFDLRQTCTIWKWEQGSKRKINGKENNLCCHQKKSSQAFHILVFLYLLFFLPQPGTSLKPIGWNCSLWLKVGVCTWPGVKNDLSGLSDLHLGGRAGWVRAPICPLSSLFLFLSFSLLFPFLSSLYLHNHQWISVGGSLL